jgi:hypothetical protein
MKIISFISSPLEQFVVNPIFFSYVFDFTGLSFSNQSIVLVLISFFLQLVLEIVFALIQKK